MKQLYKNVVIVFGPDRIKFIEKFPPDEKIRFEEDRLIVRYDNEEGLRKKIRTCRMKAFVMSAKEMFLYE